MTVSINGTSGLIFNDASVQNTSAITGGFAFRNRIINGAMVIDQRNAGASVTTASGSFAYTLDRYRIDYTQTSKYTVQQNAGSVTPPTGFANYFGATSTSAYSVTSTDQFSITQFIEGYNIADLGWGTADAKTVTLSFWVRSSLTGTFGGAITNISVRSYPFTYTISVANTWEYKTVTIEGDTSGTWVKTNARALAVYFSLGAGSSVSGTAGAWNANDNVSATGATSVVGTNGATFYITGVQLEKGSTATSFDYRPYTTELQLAQRYYFQYVKGADQSVGIGTYYSATAMYTVIQTPVTMRAKPTLSSASGTNYYSFFRNSAGDNFDSLSLDGYEHINGAMLKNTTEMSGTAGQAGFVTTNNASAALALSSEL
jgi:hypothetical protein